MSLSNVVRRNAAEPPIPKFSCRSATKAQPNAVGQVMRPTEARVLGKLAQGISVLGWLDRAVPGEFRCATKKCSTRVLRGDAGTASSAANGDLPRGMQGRSIVRAAEEMAAAAAVEALSRVGATKLQRRRESTLTSSLARSGDPCPHPVRNHRLQRAPGDEHLYD